MLTWLQGERLNGVMNKDLQNAKLLNAELSKAHVFKVQTRLSGSAHVAHSSARFLARLSFRASTKVSLQSTSCNLEVNQIAGKVNVGMPAL